MMKNVHKNQLMLMNLLFPVNTFHDTFAFLRIIFIVQSEEALLSLYDL